MPAVPDSLVKVRRGAADMLRSRLDALCTEADDKFFDLSQNAPADEQSLYFDAMKELRLQRAAIIDAVLAGFEADFVVVSAVEPAAAKGKGLGIMLDSLTLLGDDELDVSVAFQGMVGRGRDLVGNELEHLRQRFDKVLGKTLEAERLPLHPERVCEHFRTATEKLAIPLKAKLILFKFFERTLIDALPEIIAQANEVLARAGILPEIKSAKPRAVPSPDSGRGRGGDGAAKKKKLVRSDDDDEENGAGGDAIGAAMSELLAFARQTMAGRGGGGGGGGFSGGGFAGGAMAGGPDVGGAGLPMIALSDVPAGQLPVMHGGQMMVGGSVVRSDVPVQVLAPVELTALLTRLQQLQPVAAPAVPGELIDHVDPVDVKSGLSELIQAGEAQPRALNGADDDVISLVSMLFDFILDDHDLPSEMKALIGRLQIPLLKVALLDKEFFGDEAHPARQLVNSLAKAGIGWTRDSDDGLYAKIEEVVFAVLSEFIDDLSLFERLGAGFAEFVAEREKRMAMIEARVRDREEGKAKTDTAQRDVRQAIAARLAGRALPPEAIAIVQDAWQRVLYMTAVRDGQDSDVWKQRLKVLEVLVWCSQRQTTEEGQRKQRELVPRLLVSLRNGFVAEGLDLGRGEAMLTALQGVLQKLLAGEQAPAVVRVEPEPEPAPAAPVKTGVDPRWLDMADHLAPGAWIEFVEPDFKVRGKIAARIRSLNKYIFVNGRGVKIAEKTVEQLAADFEAGVARLVSDAALFDRALEDMIGRLKEGRASTG